MSEEKPTKWVLMNPDNPNGWKLEELLVKLRQEIHIKQAKIVNDARPVAQRVHGNNVKILALLKEAEACQRDSYAALDALAPNQGPTGTPRIGLGSNS